MRWLVYCKIQLVLSSKYIPNLITFTATIWEAVHRLPEFSLQQPLDRFSYFHSWPTAYAQNINHIMIFFCSKSYNSPPFPSNKSHQLYSRPHSPAWPGPTAWPHLLSWLQLSGFCCFSCRHPSTLGPLHGLFPVPRTLFPLDSSWASSPAPSSVCSDVTLQWGLSWPPYLNCSLSPWPIIPLPCLIIFIVFCAVKCTICFSMSISYHLDGWDLYMLYTLISPKHLQQVLVHCGGSEFVE